MSTKTFHCEVLTRIGKKVIVSMDRRTFEDLVENHEMEVAKPILQKRCQESLDSGLGMKV